MMYGTLTPAYGRDYKSGPEALKAWNDGKDFEINCPQGSTYCSIRDTEDHPVGHTLQIRWRAKREVAVIKKQVDGKYAGNFEEDATDGEA